MLYINDLNEVMNTNEPLGEPWMLVPENLEDSFRELYPFVIIEAKDGIVTSVVDDVEARNNYIPSPDPNKQSDYEAFVDGLMEGYQNG